MSVTKEFADIKITGADEKLTHVPEPSRPLMYDVYLTLSESPPSPWSQLFDETWRQHLYSMKRRAQVVGQHIVIHCPLDEIETSQKPELLKVIAEVNGRYRQFADQQAARDKLAAEQAAAAEKRKKETLGGLRFE
jgi:hypothetical protein